ncbi:MAG: hypothetical protein K9L59_03790 [Desulfobacterales bacterium]|nr:hypothetical protein [Desulfobacterales bacterium]
MQKKKDETEMANDSFDANPLALFKQNNPHCEIITDEKAIIIEKPWGTDDARLVFDASMYEQFNDLNSIMLHPQFDAVIHLDKNEIEFIFAFLSPDEEPSKSYLDRKFEVHLSGATFECSYAEPSERLFFIAQAIRRKPSDRGIVVVPQLKAFRDFQRLDSLPKGISSYFENKVPRSFFVSTELQISEIDLVSTCRHINFLTKYYDRRSPFIEIRDKDTEELDSVPRPKRYFEADFPPSLAISPIDDVILKLIEVSAHSAPRYAFLYLYQVIEYSAFYFVDDKAKRSLRNFLRDPSLINCDDNKIGQLMSILTELQCNDDVKMKRVIEYHCNPEILWQEIEHDKDFFATKCTFNGGFECPALIASDTTSASWAAMWMPKLYDHLTKTRNCLVHARERRQDKVILPTINNNNKIARYMPLIRRLAEQLAICTAPNTFHPTFKD